MASASHYLKFLAAAAKSGRVLMCPFCGAYTTSINNQGICHSCENIIALDRSALMKNESALCTMLDDYNKQLSAQDYEAALKAYDTVLAKYPTPNYMYVKALTYISYSNYELSKIRYDLPGFMEDNSVHRENSSRMFSSAKLLFNKAIYHANSATAQPSDSVTYGSEYIMFLSAIKLGDLASAKSHLDRIRASNNLYISAYAGVVLDSSLGNFEAVSHAADSMLKSNNFPVNILYYVAYAQFKLGRHGDAEKLTKALGSMFNNKTIASLNMYASMLK
jgi:tetratricopeptide (TPR) repeat protein